MVEARARPGSPNSNQEEGPATHGQPRPSVQMTESSRGCAPGSPAVSGSCPATSSVLIFVLSMLLPGPQILIYLAGWLLIPLDEIAFFPFSSALTVYLLIPLTPAESPLTPSLRSRPLASPTPPWPGGPQRCPPFHGSLDRGEGRQEDPDGLGAVRLRPAHPPAPPRVPEQHRPVDRLAHHQPVQVGGCGPRVRRYQAAPCSVSRETWPARGSPRLSTDRSPRARGPARGTGLGDPVSPTAAAAGSAASGPRSAGVRRSASAATRRSADEVGSGRSPSVCTHRRPRASSLSTSSTNSDSLLPKWAYTVCFETPDSAASSSMLAPRYPSRRKTCSAAARIARAFAQRARPQPVRHSEPPPVDTSDSPV